VDLVINSLQPSDWEEVRAIYQEGIATWNATFETEVPSWEKWDRSHLQFGRLVGRRENALVGWAALSPVSDRCCYEGVAEASVYVGSRHTNQGTGTALLRALIETSEKHGIWTLQAGIFPENKASLGLVKKCGFREIGRRERLGKLNDAWCDVLLLERRSRVVGT
jgi:L-amino acid N-acyltransferase YncA